MHYVLQVVGIFLHHGNHIIHDIYLSNTNGKTESLVNNAVQQFTKSKIRARACKTAAGLKTDVKTEPLCFFNSSSMK